MGCRLHHGSPLMIDHTPGAAVSAGDVVPVGGLNCIAHRDIVIDVKGALAYPGGNAGYKADLEADASFSAGDEVWVDAVNFEAGPSGTLFVGYCIVDADAGSAVGDTEVYFVHDAAHAAAS